MQIYRFNFYFFVFSLHDDFYGSLSPNIHIFGVAVTLDVAEMVVWDFWS
jgi:hypothetical protein